MGVSRAVLGLIVSAGFASLAPGDFLEQPLAPCSVEMASRFRSICEAAAAAEASKGKLQRREHRSTGRPSEGAELTGYLQDGRLVLLTRKAYGAIAVWRRLYFVDGSGAILIADREVEFDRPLHQADAQERARRDSHYLLVDSALVAWFSGGADLASTDEGKVERAKKLLDEFRVDSAFIPPEATLADRPGAPSIRKGAVGELELGMAASEVERRFPGRVSETRVMREGLEPALEVRLANGARVVAELDEEARVWAIRISDPRIPTAEGVAVGDTLGRVFEVYPGARLASGPEEGGFLSVVVDAIGGYFSFDPSGVTDAVPERSRLENRRIESIVIQQ